MITINLTDDAPDIGAVRIPLAEMVTAPPPGGAAGPFVYELQLGDGLTLLLDEWQAADLITALHHAGLTV
jgi:hypothetical protein